MLEASSRKIKQWNVGWSKSEAKASVLTLEFIWGAGQETAAQETTMKSIKGIENVQVSVAAGVTGSKGPCWWVLVGEWWFARVMRDSNATRECSGIRRQSAQLKTLYKAHNNFKVNDNIQSNFSIS